MFYSFLLSIIPLLFWFLVLIAAILMYRKNGGEAERFLITGASFKIFNVLLAFTKLVILGSYYMDKTYESGNLIAGYEFFINFISMVGTILLIYAFWLKFKTSEIKRVPKGGTNIPLP